MIFSGNQNIAIDASTPPAVLASGSAVVFAVDQQSGERIHLFSIEPGDAILPVSNPAGSGWDLVAVPLEISEVEPREPTVFARENWLTRLGEALRVFCPPGEIRMAEPGMLILPRGKRVAIDAGLIYVRLDLAGGRLAGTAIPEGETLALVPGLWLEPDGDGPDPEAEWTVLQSPPPDAADTLRKTLDLVITAFLQVLGDVRRRRRDEDRRRLAERRRMEARMMRTAVQALSGGSGQDGAEVETVPDPLEAAVRAVAAALCVKLRPAPEGSRNVERLRALCEASGLRTRMVLLSGEWWRQENGPLLAWREDGAPVALLPLRTGFFGRPRYEIFDPAAGTRERATAESSAGLNAFARMLYRPLPQDLSSLNLIRYLLAERRGDIRTIVLAGIAASALGMAAPQGAAILIGQAIPDADSGMVWQVAAGMVAAAFGSALFLLAQSVATLRAQSSAFQTLQCGVWDYLLRLSPAYFRGFTVGQLRMRADAVTRIHQMLTADSLRSLLAGVTSFLTLALMFWYSPALALIALTSGLVVVAVTWFGVRALYRVQSEWQNVDEILSGLVLQSINAVSKLRVAGAANRAFTQWAFEYSRKQRLSIEIRTIRDRVRIVNMTMPALATALGFLWLLSTKIALGPFLACNAALTSFLGAVTAAGDTCAGLVLAANLWQRMRTILEARPEIRSSSTHPGKLRGAIAVESLTFRYRDDGPLILDSVSVRAEPGECIALTGPSGSGKSTLLNLLLRFEIPQSGAIYLDGRELSSLDIGAVRGQIGVVTQDGRVMAGSVFENICTGGVRTMDDAWEAARAAGMAEDIEAMPMGMHTVVSEGGGNLSGGQRQRLLIARALVLKPSILIFDEATSALDNRTQAVVTESLKRMKATRILVAHRLSTIRTADRIYVIEKGRVVQEGTYTQLVDEPGLFRNLARRQTI